MPDPIWNIEDLDGEIWEPIPGYEELYAVSNHGRVKSLDKFGRRPRILRQNVKHHGYRTVCLYQHSRQRRFMIHRLVLEAFVGPCPDGMECCHNDGNTSNNHLSNLYWGTRIDNAQDRIRHGTNHHIRKTHCPQGHPYDEANTRVYRNSRYCRTCARDHSRNRKNLSPKKALSGT
ncbi:NUMOD4 motif-containing HNH endonuclease [Mycolicibacterium fortuitum]|uniref:NUMOD4 motif-containing HNH endonuclease n=1 Tax=Mycolicibacterium fortuitum TaxID=1766 RepID=UPI002624FCC9|nr:NUMOD4 motif-containing HNH endonuclease [Mycolicibacterium fortuitum]